METKLTLKLDSGVIGRAKGYARKRNTSLSKLVENYLEMVTHPEDEDTSGISPLVKSLSGVLNLPAKHNRKVAYGQYLEKKYGKTNG
ncbi:MAG: DUF6364 family protein [Bacteroidia bacterium]